MLMGIAMLAVVGHMFTAAGARLPGELANGVAFTSIEGSGYKALSQLAPADLACIIITVGFLETRVMKEVVKGEFPGDLRNGAPTAQRFFWPAATRPHARTAPHATVAAPFFQPFFFHGRRACDWPKNRRPLQRGLGRPLGDGQAA